MQLKQRIKKIEDILNLNKSDSNYCECYKKYLSSVIESVYYPEKEVKIYPMPDFEKGFCDICKKRFSENDKKLYGNIGRIYEEDSKIAEALIAGYEKIVEEADAPVIRRIE